MHMQVVIGLSAVVVAASARELLVLTVAGPGDEAALPSGPFDPARDRTFELSLRAFVTAQTRFQLGYVEQLYTFGDLGRDAPLAELTAAGDQGGADAARRIISVGYLALTPEAQAPEAAGARWTPWPHFFPWEDWRGGRPPCIDRTLAPALLSWAARGGQRRDDRLRRARALFALEGAAWNEERVLDRYELLYEAGLAQEAARDHRQAPDAVGELGDLGCPMVSDHRRILATGLGRLRGKLKYRPVAFDLTPEVFTLGALQRTVEAVSGVLLHKQNFRRGVERTGLVEGLGRLDAATGGRPAELFRYRREATAGAAVSGLPLPMLRDA